MNILLVGGSCRLMDSMILKLRKEGHRVFLLTGDKYRHNKYQKVFERYDSPMTAKISTIFWQQCRCDYFHGTLFKCRTKRECI